MAKVIDLTELEIAMDEIASSLRKQGWDTDRIREYLHEEAERVTDEMEVEES